MYNKLLEEKKPNPLKTTILNKKSLKILLFISNY